MKIKVGDIVRDKPPERNDRILWAGEVIQIEKDRALVKWDPDYKLSDGLWESIKSLVLAEKGIKPGKQEL